jgi:Flp pilus assembly protein TadD
MAKVGYAALLAGKLETAKTVFEGLLALDPFDVYFLSALGSVAQQNGNLEEAERRYSRALEINPFSPFALSHRGEVRLMQGRVEDGVDDLLRAIEEDPAGRDPGVQRARATLTILIQQLDDLGLRAPGLKTQAKVDAHAKTEVSVPTGGMKPKLPKLDADALEKFAKESEGFLVRRKKKP